MEWRSPVTRFGLFTAVLLVCVVALVMLSINPSVKIPRLNLPSGIVRPRFKFMPFHNPIMERLGLHGNEYSHAVGDMTNEDQKGLHAELGSGTTNHKPGLLIVGYLRTGSTFTASLFSQHLKTFYVFEPLHMFNQMIERKHFVRYLNGTVRYISSPDMEQTIAQETMQQWLHCGFTSIDKDSLEDRFHFTYSKSMRPFVMCLRQVTARFRAGYSFAIKECLPPLARNCAAADLRVFKTIRLRMAAAENLIRRNPLLKVIHLVRDPRGMLYSQLKTKLVRKGREATAVREFCSNMMVDIAVTKRLLSEGQANLYVIRYEDIAYDPLNQARRLYDFVNMTLDQRIINYVKESTSMNLNDSCAYCTRRSNSTKTANNWRSRISAPFVDAIDYYCKDVYKELGYFPLAINDIRNLSIPSGSSESLYDILKRSNRNSVDRYS